MILLGSAVVLPIAALLFPVMGWPSATENWLVGLMIAGMPEMLCLAGVALLGREGFQGLRGRVLRTEVSQVSKARYYGCLLYCLLNSLPISLYAYAPHWMPGGSMKYLILALTDLGFVCSILCAGGEFWEKFRRLFIWEGKS